MPFRRRKRVDEEKTPGPADEVQRGFDEGVGEDPLGSLPAEGGSLASAVGSPDGAEGPRVAESAGFDEGVGEDPLGSLPAEGGSLASAVGSPDGAEVSRVAEPKALEAGPEGACRPARRIVEEVLESDESDGSGFVGAERIEPGVRGGIDEANRIVVDAGDSADGGLDSGRVGGALEDQPGPPAANASTLPASRTGRPLELYSVGESGRGAWISPASFGEPLGRSDIRVDHGCVAAFELRAASIRGRMKRYEGRPCEDEFAVASVGGEAGSDRYVIAVVCDGVSGAPHSFQAARTAAQTACRTLADQLGSSAHVNWPRVFEHVNISIVEQARRSLSLVDSNRDAVRRTMATTLVAAVVAVEGASVGQGSVASLGDSGAWMIDGDGGLRPVTRVKNADADLASSRVRALPRLLSSDEIEVREVAIASGAALLLTTDGLGEMFGSGGTPEAAFVAEAWRVPPNPYSYAGQADFASKGFDDDRTVVGLWRVSQ